MPSNTRTWGAGRSGAAALVGMMLTAALLAGCTTTPQRPASMHPGSTAVSGSSASGSPSVGSVSDVVVGLEAPWSIAFHGDTALVSARDSGKILEIVGGKTREVGSVEGSTASGEGGLLGIAVFAGFLYAYFTAGNENRIQRFELTGKAGSLGLGAPQTILEDLPAANVHNGGRIAFGPDKLLYVTVGDAGDSPKAQDRESLAGKILRLTPEGTVPADNPFKGSPVYSLGHRNPQGLAWAKNGSMYASEFGQNTWDELNLIKAGANYGWPEVEGIAKDDRYMDPVQQWAPGEASPSGMTIADDSIWIANLRGERLRRVPLDQSSSLSEHLVGTHGRLRDVVVAPDGALWVLTNNTDGRGQPGAGDDRILRFTPPE